jgi:hypothetical protein
MQPAIKLYYGKIFHSKNNSMKLLDGADNVSRPLHPVFYTPASNVFRYNETAGTDERVFSPALSVYEKYMAGKDVRAHGRWS